MISSKQSDRLEVTNTGFRLLPSFDSSAEGSITVADRIITHIDGTTSVLPALAMSLAGGVVQFSSAEHGEPDNVRPLLEWEGLEPFEGVPSDLFTFSVFYQDEDGDPPQYVKLHLDDTEHLMQAVEKGDYADGVIYSVQVDGLSWGPHEFSFSQQWYASGEDLLGGGALIEGDDPDFNQAPVLWDNDVEPWSASPGKVYFQDPLSR